MARVDHHTRESAKQDHLILLCRFMRQAKITLRQAVFAALTALLWLVSSTAAAIPGNFPITNTATVDYRVGPTAYSASANATVTTDPSAGNSAPYDVTLSNASVPENVPGAVVGDVEVLDLDPSDTHTITLSDPRFEVVGTTLQLVPGAEFDFESETTIALTVTATDPAGASINRTLSISVVDVNEAPDAIILDSTEFDANTPGAVVGGLTTSDVDAGDSHTYVVDDPRFEVVAGELKLLDTESLPLGTSVTLLVTSTDSGGLSIQQTFEVTSTPPGGGAGTNASITALELSPSGQPFDVTNSQCDAGSGFANLADPVTGFGQTLALPAQLNLASTGLAKSGASIFVQVSDVDANLDDAALDSVEVLVANNNGDQEQVRLFESNPASGIFVGYVPTLRGTAIPGDCLLQTGLDDAVTLTYTDAADTTDVAVTSVLVDPLGLVFDSATGQPVNGAVVTLLNADGTLATVFDDDGVSAYPDTVSSGDGQGGTGAGEFRFPFVNAGDYRLQITPPNRFRFPSTALDTDLQALPGAPYALNAGSTGGVFQVPVGPAVQVDVPLDLLPVVPSASSLELAAVTALAGGEAVGGAQCFDGNAFAVPSNGVSLALGLLGDTGQFALQNRNRFSRGDVITVTLTDTDQDLDPFAPDTVEVAISVEGQADQERLLLTETNDSTGVFSGFLQTAAQASGLSFNCQLEALPNSTVRVSYVDTGDAADASEAEALLDPAWTVFASDTGRLLDGAEVTLVDALTGLPAENAVFAADGVTAYPATVTTGQGASDAGGGFVDFASGTFIFPLIAPGDYRLEITPPVSYVFPSVIADSDLNSLPGGPLQLGPASRGQTFTVVAGQPAAFDVPLDPVAVDVFISKQASKDTASIGEFVQYRVTVSNANAQDEVSDTVVVDTLPVGFRLVPDSVRLGAQPLTQNPVVSTDGAVVQLPAGQLPPGTSLEISYVVEVTAGAEPGSARNRATVTGIGVGSANTAFADVLVREDLFASKSFIIGQVLESDCSDGQPRQGVAGVRVWLENGSFAVTDEEGKYHFAGVEPGTHVVQMDTATLPISHEPAACEENTEFAGSSISQFVDLSPGALWRADFYARKRPAVEGVVTTRLTATANPDTRRVRYEYVINTGIAPLENMRATVMLDDASSFVSGSLRLNGQPKPDPRGLELGALSYRLPDSAGRQSYHLRFEVETQSAETLNARAVVQFAADGERYRSDVSSAEVGFNWPDTLVTLTEQDDAGVNSRVAEPSQGGARAKSPLARTPYQRQVDAKPNVPYVLPEQDKGEPPTFDKRYIERHQQQLGIVFPPPRYNPAMPAIPVAILHSSEQRPHLLVDGELVHALTFDSVVNHPELGLTLSIWDGVPISEDDSLLAAQLLNAQGKVVMTDELNVHFSGAPVRAELVEDRSYLRADGLHAPVVAVRLFDRAGYPLRAGSTGEFSVAEPYRPLDQTRHLENLSNEFTNQRYRVLEEGVAYIQLEPTLVTGEVELDFRFDAVRQDTVRARITPGKREWILVGLAEASFTRRDLSGNARALGQAGLADEHDQDGRVAFYAKGTVKGEWLLTVAYDTDKAFEQELKRQIDPNQFYTLYGDGSDQLFDAQSQRKLYLKLERDRFQTLFGDYDTAFSRSELARYERRLNGVNAGYFGDKVEVNAFASDTRQGFVRDEIAGDGTSGLYRLSRQRIVRNSEQIRVVTRDRFSPEQVLATNTLTRYLDYTIDYDRGTLIFRQPIASQDAQFNPIFIEAEYEVEQAAGRDLVAGARLAYKLSGEDSELALTYLRDDSTTQGGDLLAADLTWNFSATNTVTVEVAQSDTDSSGQSDAYLLEFKHNGEHLAGRAYLREQESNFGLGNQSVFELGVRKVGVEGELRLQDKWIIQAQAFEQTFLEDDTDRVVVDAKLEYRGDKTQARAGLRSVQETTATRSADATQVLAGVSRSVLNRRLELRADAEVDVSSGEDNADYPSRVLLGADYKILPEVSVILEQELSFSDIRDTRDTRVGMRARPWRGGDVHTLLQRRSGEDGERLFATTGVLQQWRLAERWLFDVGMDRVQTLKEQGIASDPAALSFNPLTPPASGSIDNDFTAYYLGAGYQHDAWNIAARVERHDGDQARKWNYLLGANRQLAEGRVVSSSLVWLDERRDSGARTELGDLRLAQAWRPQDSRFAWFSRLDWVEERQRNGVFDTQTRKWINNTAMNVQFNPRHQLSVHLGVKWVKDEIDGMHFDSTTGLAGFEYRYHFHSRWDIGVHGSRLFTSSAGVERGAYGASIGFNAFTNSWVSLGYNWQGLDDDDFAAAEYSAEGVFLKFRLKFDQELARRFLSRPQLTASNQHANGR